jgi:hypothetical protein
MPKTLLQKVMKACQWLNRAWIQSFDAESVANYFLYVYEFTTNDSDIIHAMSRRLFELVSIWLLTSTENKKGIKYSVTDLWVNTDCSKIHLWYKLITRENKDDDVSKWWKRKSDKTRKVRAESEVKSENKVLNTLIEKEAPKLQPTTLRTKFLSFFTTH